MKVIVNWLFRFKGKDKNVTDGKNRDSWDIKIPIFTFCEDFQFV